MLFCSFIRDKFFKSPMVAIIVGIFLSLSFYGHAYASFTEAIDDSLDAYQFFPSIQDECSVDNVQIIDPAYARMMRLDTSGNCSDEYVDVPDRPEEICLFEGLSTLQYEDLDFSEDSYDGPVPVSVELESYRLNQRAITYVERNIKIFTEDIPNRTAHWLARSGRYIRMMTNILREEGLPDDMAWLPLIESGFNPIAYSRSHAAGPWQFIKGTARRYGLTVNYWVDERRDPVKSTRAAARYLKDLYDTFGSWSLAMAAYNAGEGKIRRALKKTNSNDFWGLLKTRHIRNETKNYVPKFIAARMIAVQPEKYGITDIQYHDDFTFDEVVLTRPVSLDIAARCAGISEQELKELNPELRRWITPPVKEYTLRIPRGTREQFEAKLSKVPVDHRVTMKLYTVRSGDSLWTIARRYGVTISDIREYNKMGRHSLIHPGQKLIIPISLSKT